MHLTAQQYHPVDISLKGEIGGGNPFYTDVKAVFYGPNNKVICIPGFYDGEGQWRIRFSPTVQGRWEYTTYSSKGELNGIRGTVECIPNENSNVHGGLKVDKLRPHHFRYQDGTPYFMMAYEADWLWALGLAEPDDSKIKEFVESIKPYGFNSIIVNIFAYDTSWAKGRTSDKDYGPPPSAPWKGSNGNFDFDNINVEFFRNYDRLIQCLFENGIVAHIFFKVYNKSVQWPEKYTVQEDLFFKYVTARYQAFPNIIWDFSKESYYERDKDYIFNRLSFVRSLDGYQRLVTVHDDPLFYGNERYSRILDFLTVQQHGDYGELYCSAIIERQKKRGPIFNSEFAYECGGPEDTEVLPVTACNTAEEVIDRTYEVVMAGAYPAYYYTCTAWDVIDYSYQPPGYNYMKILYDFFTSIEWWELEPHPEITNGNLAGNQDRKFGGRLRCLANPGKEYVFYMTPNLKGRFDIDMSDKMDIVWINTRTGERIVQKEPLSYISKSPFKDVPSILHIKMK